ncbi:MAG: hypothetical protein M3P51_13895, partial [Chloroflexota bacterium]|nr:hypothetical protein [Chloroflexota bacterium]
MRAILIAMFLVVSAYSPVAPQDPTKDEGAVFRLTIYGDVPANEAFELHFSECYGGFACSDALLIAPICGPEDVYEFYEYDRSCQGDSSTYTVTVASGTGMLSYEFVRRYGPSDSDLESVAGSGGKSVADEG